MVKTDQSVIIIIVLIILIHLSIWIVGSASGKLQYLITILNLLSASSIILYWIQKQLRITQHIFELREILGLTFELSIVCIAAYSLSKDTSINWIRIFQYIIFGIHFTALILFLIFMLTFKLNKLM